MPVWVVNTKKGQKNKEEEEKIKRQWVGGQ